MNSIQYTMMFEKRVTEVCGLYYGSFVSRNTVGIGSMNATVTRLVLGAGEERAQQSLFVFERKTLGRLKACSSGICWNPAITNEDIEYKDEEYK